MKKYIKLALVIIVSIWAGGILIQKNKETTVNIKDKPQEPFITSVDFLTMGDLLYHSTFLQDQSVDAFYEGFKHMDSYFEEADFVLANYETTTNPKRKYSGYPMFNTPPNAMKAIKKSGINILNTNNNHTLDTGLEGVISTLETIRAENIMTVGTQLPEEPKRLDISKNGIKIGLVSFSYGYNGLESRITQDELDTYLSKINDAEIEKAITDSNQVNDFTLVIVHWGTEYQVDPTTMQKKLANNMSEWGADVIIGAHPHVVQPVEMINDTLVIYSLGNYVSDQRLESIKKIETERGLVVGFTLEKNLTEGTKQIKNKNAIPTWVYKRKNNNKTYYEVIPAKDFIDGKINLNLSADYQLRIKQTYEVISDRVLPGIEN